MNIETILIVSGLRAPWCTQGAEFDAVKPLMECRVGFKGQVWYHVNFWARSRTSKKIKRFFAEVHYKPLPLSSFADSPLLAAPVPIAETCTIIYMPFVPDSRTL